MVGHLFDAVVRDVADPHALRRRGSDVDVVEPHARCRDDAQCRQLLELLGRDGLERHERDHVVAGPRRRGHLDDDVREREGLTNAVRRERRVAEDAWQSVRP